MPGIIRAIEDLFRLDAPSTGGIEPAPPPAPHGRRLDDRFLTSIVAASDGEPDQALLADGFVHVSRLVNFCARQHALSRRASALPERRLTSGHRILFAQGKACEEHVIDAVISRGEAGRIYAWWECPCGATQHRGTFNEARTCNRCGQQVRVHGQPVLRHDDFRLVGRPDLTLHVDGPYKVVTEVKSVSANIWGDTSAPQADHIMQALMYRWLYAHLGYAVANEVVLLYVNRGFVWGDPYKEYHVDAEDPFSTSLVDESLRMLGDLREHDESSGSLPPRVCSNAQVGLRRECPLVNLCFNMD